VDEQDLAYGVPMVMAAVHIFEYIITAAVAIGFAVVLVRSFQDLILIWRGK
jgi:hypothetical protein